MAKNGQKFYCETCKEEIIPDYIIDIDQKEIILCAPCAFSHMNTIYTKYVRCINCNTRLLGPIKDEQKGQSNHQYIIFNKDTNDVLNIGPYCKDCIKEVFEQLTK